MKKNFTFFALLLVLFSCKKELSETQSNPNEMKTSSVRTEGSRYTYLTVEVVNEVNGIASKIQSDVSRLYVDGVENVRAEFQHSNGDFYMMSNTMTNKPALRKFSFPSLSDFNNNNDYRIRIKDPNDMVAIQNITEGQGPTTMVLRLWTYNNSGQSDIIFNPSEVTNSDFVFVTKMATGTSDERWEVVPASHANAGIKRPNIATATLESVPFKIIIRKKAASKGG